MMLALVPVPKYSRPSSICREEFCKFRYMGFSSVALALTAFGAIGGVSVSAGPANAVVYCKAVGVPKGCVARPTRARVVYCTAPGLPVGCVARPVAVAPAVVAVPVATPHVVYCKRRGVPKGCVVR
jgi:hypothetical protein